MKREYIDFIIGTVVILLLGAAMFTFTAVKHNEYVNKENVKENQIIGYKYIENHLYEIHDNEGIYTIKPVD